MSASPSPTSELGDADTTSGPLPETDLGVALEAILPLLETNEQRALIMRVIAERDRVVSELENRLYLNKRRLENAINTVPDYADFNGTPESAVGVAAELVEQLAPLLECRDALADLVTLKDGPRDANYKARRPEAWERARTALRSDP